MLKWLFKKQIDAFDRDYGYDSSYVREIISADLDAAIKFSKVMGLTKYRKGVPADVRCAVGLVGTMAEDCGPCTQLAVTMAERDGVAPEVLRAILARDVNTMPEPVALAFRFAQAALAHDQSRGSKPMACRTSSDSSALWCHDALFSAAGMPLPLTV